MVRGDQVGIDGQAENPEPLLEIELPDRGVPVPGAALELLPTPDVVDQNVDVAVLLPDPLRQTHDLAGVEMVDDDRDAVAAQRGDELGSFLDRLGAVVVGPQGTPATAAAATDDRGAGLSQRGRDTTAGPACRPGDHRDAATQGIRIRPPACHGRVTGSSQPARRSQRARSSPREVPEPGEIATYNQAHH